MSSKPLRPKSKRIRHRITDVELAPTTSNRQISGKVLVDDETVCELPWIKSGRPLRWTKLIVHDGSDDSRVALEVQEKHSIKDRRFRSDAYIISSVQEQTEVTVGFNGIAWNATFKLLTSAAAEQAFATGLNKLRELKTAPSALRRLGKARPVFEAMLQLGSEISEIIPTAKIVFMICTNAWEKLEAQEQCNEEVRELLDGLAGILDFVELVRKHAQTEQLRGTIGEFLTLLEDVSICVMQQTESRNSSVRNLRGLLSPRENDKTRELLSRFERLRAELSIGIGAETHKQVHSMDKRLRKMDLHSLLSQLYPVSPTGYDPSRACQEGTREGIISNIVSWTQQRAASESMLWVHGQAGIGKSSIATSVCRQLANEKVLAASFFCKRDDPGLRDPLRLINSIAHGLATRYAPYAHEVAAAIEDDRELCIAHMDIRYEGLIKKPLQSLEDSSISRPLIILIDALDECGAEDSRRNLLRHLLDLSKLVPWLKCVVTSRPDGDIQNFFSKNKLYVSWCNVNSFDASDDIRAYIQKELGDIARRHRWDEGSIDRLCEKAGGVFIWAATVKKYLTGFRGSSVPRLQKVLYDQKSTVSDHLDALYRNVILAGMKDVDEDQKALFRECIGVIVSTSIRQPLSISSLSSLLLGQLDPLDMEEAVNSLYAVFHLDNHLDGAVRFYHPSFADYATNPSRSEDLYVDLDKRNTEIAMGCFKTMERELRFNICELETSYLLNCQVLDLASRIKSKISDQLGYACTYWISHLMDSPKGTLTSEIEALVNSPRVLYWLEVLSLLGRVEVGLQGLQDIQEWLPKDSDELLESVKDMYRFTSTLYDPISTSAPHIYVSALAFAPSLAQVTRRFQSLFPNTVIVTSGRDTNWPRWLRSLTHPDQVTSLAVSPDGRHLVTGSSDEAVRIWEARSGTVVGEPLFSDLGFVTSVALSPDGSRVASGHLHRAIQFWDVQARAAIGEPLRGHSGIISCVIFSPDGNRLASGSVDTTIRLWDAETGAAVGDPLIGHSELVESVTFSPDSTYIISSALDNTLRVWSAKTNAMLSELPIDHAYSLNHLAFSPDGRSIFYGSSAGLGTVQWDSNAGTLTGEPHVFHPCRVSCLALSSDGQRVVFGTYENEVGIWDIEKGSLIGELLTGHFDSVRSIAFFPDGRRVASASHDQTVRLWDTTPQGVDVGGLLVGHSDQVACVAFSPDGSRIVSGSHDKTIRLWDIETGVPIGEPLIGHTSPVDFVSFSPNGSYIISGSFGKTLQVWDATTGAAIGERLVIPSGTSRTISLSLDGIYIASVAEDSTITISLIPFPSEEGRLIFNSEGIVQLWRTTASEAGNDQSTNELDCVRSVAFYPDGGRIASGSWGGTIRLWDGKTGAPIGKPLAGHSNAVSCIAVSLDGECIVSGSSDRTLRLWDARLGVVIGEPLVGHTNPVTCVAFSPSGNRIVSCSYDNTVRLWDRKTGAAVGEPFVGHTMEVFSVAFSPDSTRIISGSRDGSVRVWDARTGAETHELKSENTISQHPTLPKTTASWPPHTYALPPHPEHSGWVSLDGESLLLWVPVQYRRQYSLNTLHVISADPSLSMIRLDFSKFAHGPSWTAVTCDEIREDFV